MTPDGTSSLRSDLAGAPASARVVEVTAAPISARRHDADLRPHVSEVPTAH
jgi:hypothetical protein